MLYLKKKKKADFSYLGLCENKNDMIYIKMLNPNIQLSNASHQTSLTDLYFFKNT